MIVDASAMVVRQDIEKKEGTARQMCRGSLSVSIDYRRERAADEFDESNLMHGGIES